MAAARSAAAMRSAVAREHVCARPLFASCDGPRTSAEELGQKLCWFKEESCALADGAATLCAEASPVDVGDVRLCPCVGALAPVPWLLSTLAARAEFERVTSKIQQRACNNTAHR